LDLAKRVATLKSQVTELQEQVRSDRAQRRKDWRRAAEKFAGDADLQSVFADAMKLREADRKRARKSARARSRCSFWTQTICPY
jgi:uncharacterized protein HemX